MEEYKYILMQFVDRELIAYKCKTEEEAFNAMKEAFMSAVEDELELTDEDEIEESDDCAISDTFAWLNGHEYVYDWFIEEIDKMLTP